MAYLPLALPPGFYRNGPDYGAKDRWKTGSLVRFIDGKARAIGGWQERLKGDDTPIGPLITDPTIEAPRNVFGWRDNVGGRYLALGTTLKLKIIDAIGTVTDITPLAASFTPGLKDSDLVDGYGIGPYGKEAYGRSRSGSGLAAGPVGAWAMDAWGQDLLAAGPLQTPTTKIYTYTPGSAPGTKAVPLTNAPVGLNDFLVTDQRIVMAVGTGANQRGVTWSASENNTTWAPAVTNQAGGITLAGYGALLSVDRVGNDILIVGEKDAHVGRYLGPPYVYGFERKGDDCGCVNQASVAVTDNFAMWFNGKDFYIYDGSLVSVPCDISDWLVMDMDYQQRAKMSAFVNSDYFEITWFYQSIHSETTECDSYVTYDYMQKHWTSGRMARCCGMDRAITRDNIYVSPNGTLYNSEIAGTLTGDEIPYIVTGPIEIGNGDAIMYVDEVIAAETIPSGTKIYIRAKDFPNAPQRTTGPFTTKPKYTIVKGYGRQLEIELQSNMTGYWELGNFRLRLSQGGDK